jgi:hypothetical protein
MKLMNVLQERGEGVGGGGSTVVGEVGGGGRGGVGRREMMWWYTVCRLEESLVIVQVRKEGRLMVLARKEEGM